MPVVPQRLGGAAAAIYSNRPFFMAYLLEFAGSVENSQCFHWLFWPNWRYICHFFEIASDFTGYFVSVGHFGRYSQ
ncbi:hypothetical protein [Paenibacillus cymbidii]|uniref:hypothetical protein n=1 Tax=Paenibacillus cymbidii TaxID=1639034 RepID=UPI0010804A22|nr:hypothetical protein [Paenibacillus cymbidii]